MPPMTAPLKKSKCPLLRVERAEWPHVRRAVEARTEAAEPRDSNLCLVGMARAYEGQRQNAVTSLLSALKYHLVVGVGPPTL
jgi:hypothetical protein